MLNILIMQGFNAVFWGVFYLWVWPRLWRLSLYASNRPKASARQGQPADSIDDLPS